MTDTVITTPEAPVNTVPTDAPVTPVPPVVPEAPLNPLLPPDGKPAPTEPPVNPLQIGVVEEKVAPTEGQTYIQTSIQHLTGELGVSPDLFDSVIDKALEHGDLALINPSALGVDVSPEQAIRIKQLAQAAVQEVQDSVKRATAEVYTVAGSQAAWETSVQAFNIHAPQEQQEYAAYLADKGKLKQAAEYVLNFTKTGGFVNHITQQAEQGGQPAPTTGLTKAEYAAALSVIEREAGNRSLSSPAFAERVAQLDAQRALGRSQGR